jgi:uncharacterized protein YkwD
MKRRIAAAAPTLVLAILVGCQGGDAADPQVPATRYTPFETYGNDPRHPVVATSEDLVARTLETELERLINTFRLDRDLEALKVLPELKDLAMAHSIHMGLHEPAFFDHVSPEGHRPEDRAKEGRIDCRAIGENIAAGQSAAEAVFRSWLESPSHLANLLDPRWTHMGAGHAYLPESPYVTYWTLDLIQR